jgi:hypothetical protein
MKGGINMKNLMFWAIIIVVIIMAISYGNSNKVEINNSPDMSTSDGLNTSNDFRF